MPITNATADEAEKQTMRRRYQSEIFSLETDLERLKRQSVEVEVDVRRTKDSIAHLEATLAPKEAARLNLVRNMGQVESEILRAKKKMNEL